MKIFNTCSLDMPIFVFENSIYLSRIQTICRYLSVRFILRCACGSYRKRI